MVTIKDIAKESGVSVATVSNVINGKAKVGEETKKRVLGVIRKTGYRPNSIAQGLRSQSTQTVDIIAEDLAQFSTPYLVDGIMSVLEKHGYRTSIWNMRMYARWSDTWYDNPREYHEALDPILDSIESCMLDGVIYVAGHARIVDCFQKGFPHPAVMAYAYSRNTEIPSVLIDDEEAGYRMCRYLIQKGHTKIGVLGGMPDNIHAQQRLLGYQQALFEAKILYDPSLVIYCGWDDRGAYANADTLIDSGVTAVFCMNDRVAAGVYRRLDERGMRPGRDFSVTGFDNAEYSQYYIPVVTTMSLPLTEIGQCSAEYLLEQIAGKSPADQPSETKIRCAFVEGKSVVQLRQDTETAEEQPEDRLQETAKDENGTEETSGSREAGQAIDGTVRMSDRLEPEQNLRDIDRIRNNPADEQAVCETERIAGQAGG